MATELVPVTFSKIMQSKTYTAIILGNELKRFAIFTEPQVGKVLQGFLTDEKRRRPQTHELFSSVLENLNGKLLQIVIHDMQETIFFARLFVEQQLGDKKLLLEIDARPSDAITLALMTGIPFFCRKEVYDKTIPYQD